MGNPEGGDLVPPFLSGVEPAPSPVMFSCIVHGVAWDSRALIRYCSLAF